MLFEFVIAFIMYFAILYWAYYATEVKRLPEWLQFPPFECRKCLTFWSNFIAGLVVGLSFSLYIAMITVFVMAILTAISMHIDQRNKTISINK